MTDLTLGPDVYDPFYDRNSFIGTEIRNIVAEAGEQIPDLDVYDPHSPCSSFDLSKKVNDTCNILAAMDPEHRQRAVRLRSLYIVRRLERFMHSGIQDRLSDYHSSGIVPGDDFWPRVEAETNDILERLLQEKYQADIKSLPARNMSEGVTRHKMATVLGYELGKKIIRGGGNLVHFSYAAQPQGLPEDEKEL